MFYQNWGGWQPNKPGPEDPWIRAIIMVACVLAVLAAGLMLVFMPERATEPCFTIGSVMKLAGDCP